MPHVEKDMILGIDALGLADKDWPFKDTLDVWPNGWALGVFDSMWAGSFGDPRQKVIQLLQTGKVPALRVQLFWSSVHMLAPDGVIKARAPLWEAIAKQFPNVKVYLSPSCEYKSADVHAVQHLVNLIRQLAPSCTCVLVPEPPSPTIAGVMTEQHGTHNLSVPGGIASHHEASYDGADIFDTDIESWINHQRATGAEIAFLWCARCNGSEAGPILPIPQRTAFPTRKDMLSLIRLGSPKGTPPQPNFPFTARVFPFDANRIYKSHGEDGKGNSDPRDNKPCLIVDSKAGSAEVLTKDGALVGRLGYRDPFVAPPGHPEFHRYRYYSGAPSGSNLYGYEFGQKAMAMSGSEFVWIRVGSTVYGPCNPAFRTGSYLS
jgi:hypothetical protein